MKKFFISVIAICITATAHAVQTCPAGYYKNSNNTCAECRGGYYCPDDDNDERIKCPEWTADDTVAILESLGYTDITSAYLPQGITSWDSQAPDKNGPAWKIEHCWVHVYVITERGNIMTENHWVQDTKRYWHGTIYWYAAKAGWYLSGYAFKSTYAWYKNLLPCTNAPANTHYTGPGDPETNNCPWECDCGYVRSGDACVPASECTAGVKTLRTGTGLIYKLYSVQTTSPTIAIGLNGSVCYACLAPGAADGALNLKWDDGIFHAVNGN